MTETNPFDDRQSPMNGIDKSDLPSRHTSHIAAFSYPAEHPAVAVWTRAETGLLHRLNAHLQVAGAHLARSVVLLPYAQLRPLASRLWAQAFPDGFAPRFETSMNWSASLVSRALEATDIHFDAAIDTLTAHDLLSRAGLAEHADVLAGRLVQCAQQLGNRVACMAPQERAAWAQAARSNPALEMTGQALQWEAAVARIALEWAAVSSYQSDVLFEKSTVNSLDALVIVQGLQPDALIHGLRAVWGNKVKELALVPDPLDVHGAPPVRELANAPASPLALHACRDAEDEAQQAAACALRHIEAGRFPLALVSSDRALTRRVRAMLETSGVQMRDENGWKLSTSAAAAALMALLKAAAWNASSDAVLAWLKQAPVFADGLPALEAAMRRAQLGRWRDVPSHPRIAAHTVLSELCKAIDEVRQGLSGRHALTDWLVRLRAALQTSGMWERLQGDGAGAQILVALRLETAAWSNLQGLAQTAIWSKRRLDASEFAAWVNQTLEDSNVQPVFPQQEEVVILPMSQMLGRPFAALVMAGCDEVRLSPSPEPPGNWTAAQRLALGLPTREALEAAMRAAWQFALQTPVCDVLWRTGDEAGETLLPSALVQLLNLSDTAPDPRAQRSIKAAPVLPPLPQGDAVMVSTLSQSAYEDLRQCPYKFFAMRQLGLTQMDELEVEVGKRDFGNWLHEVLKRFHEQVAAQHMSDAMLWPAMLEQASQQTTEAMALPDGEFLPFAASWPKVRDEYLIWLHKHVAEGNQFSSAETSHRQAVGSVVLQGRIDRIDTARDGSTLVLDYKTESASKTIARVKNELEDTQMAFYAALLADDTLRAAYVNVSEKESKTVEQKKVVLARDALVEGIVSDMQKIAGGAHLPALGDGDACLYCNARGLCRKDFWSAA